MSANVTDSLQKFRAAIIKLQNEFPDLDLTVMAAKLAREGRIGDASTVEVAKMELSAALPERSAADMSDAEIAAGLAL